ncbi:hypothetical protein [Adhaeretor mobilis]|uniref:Uncharacterized protein n=1 Tax=Adhaeretor mobilis TaxID=1930276 RepID=A0A517MW86_9BACT|nr:hypothetical protein [Adhaeretor mobilis]QDS99142.1 hypothetical protein HG15A2_24340 [Adhaeretor mobilis]
MKRIIYGSTIWLLLLTTPSLHAQKVLTVGLGDAFKYSSHRNSLREIEDFYASMKQTPINIAWSGPSIWENGILGNSEALKFYISVAEIIHKNGIGVALGVKPKTLYSKSDGETWNAFQLDPKTGLRKISKGSWDLCNPESYSELYDRYERIMNLLKPRELYYIDETILGDPGEKAHFQRISTYWTSPTYSVAALESFREFLKNRSYPDADNAKFPVTTKVVAPNSKANMGLPAIPLTKHNSDWLVPDNNWPDSSLWMHWYDWREGLLVKLYSSQIELAEKVFSDNPNWKGSMVSAPTFWFCRETGADPDKIAGIPKLDYLVAGYMTGHNLMKLKPSTNKHGSKLGGMIELTRYGSLKSQDPKATLKRFKVQVDNGAELILIFPLANMNKHRNSRELDEIGMNYRPACIELWRECVGYLAEKDLQISLEPMISN